MVLEQSTKRLLIVFGVLILVYAGMQAYRVIGKRSQEKKFYAMMEKVYENNPGLKEEMAQREEMLRLYGPRALEPGFRAETADQDNNSSRTVTKLADGSEKIVVSFLDGKPREEYYMRDAHLEGAFKRWNSAGVLLEESVFKDDKYDGPHKTYYADGALKTEVTYAEGLRQGTAKNWLQNGRLSSAIEYNNNKVMSSISYYLDGSTRMKETLDESTGVLTTEAWYTNGQLSHEFASIGGKREGLLIKNVPNGFTIAEAEYKDGKNHGWCRIWNEKGVLDTELYYENGLLNKEKSKTGEVCDVDIWRFGFR